MKIKVPINHTDLVTNLVETKNKSETFSKLVAGNKKILLFVYSESH